MRTIFGSTVRPLAKIILTFSIIFSAAILSSPSAQANSKYAGLVIDAKTGKTLYARHADSKRYPASLTKMMTMYMMFEALESGRMSKKTRIRFSKYAASRPPSKLGIRAGGSISAENAIKALATKSANDVATAVAEHLGKSESNFARMMTRKARELGMSRTTFKNASGLTAKGQLTTARDMARLGIALREHYPQYYKYFSTTSFKYGKANYRNHNRLLGRVKGVDGIKTGYTRASGYNLVTSVRHNRRSIVAVVMGGKSGKSRNAQMQRLISRYMKKATRRKQRKKLAVRKTVTNYKVAAAHLQLPNVAPVPVQRSTIVGREETRIASAHTAPSPSAQVSSGSSTNDDAIKRRLLELKNQLAPVPDANPQHTAASASKPLTTASVEKPTPKPAAAKSGWQIQIGATDSEAAAKNLLIKAQKTAPRLLASVGPYTETVSKNSTILHRARFVGFANKSAARKACKYLKKRKFACLALQS